MTLENLGYNEKFDAFRKEQEAKGFETGRIIAEHKERYIVKTAQGEYEGEITGNMRFTAQNREDFPAVGDWVAITPFDEQAVIHSVFPRYSMLKRQSAGKSADIQLIAANIDYAFIIQAVDRDFNINRFERYLTICHTADVEPIIVLSKTDLVDKQRLDELVENIRKRIQKVPVFAISNESQDGYEAIQNTILRGKTYCMLGSSGVGKSTLINNLSGKTIMKTGAISTAVNKGRHVTSHRELVVLDNGGIFIDNPGMREVGIADNSGGLESTFDKIISYGRQCKYQDCTHTNENGCAVLEALKTGKIDRSSYENYLKLEKEKAHYESTVAEKRAKEKKFGHIMKNYKKDLKKGTI